MRSRLTTLLKFIFAVSVLTWLVRSDHLNFSEIKKVFHPTTLTLCLLLTTGALFLNSERFRQLLKTQNVHLSIWNAWKLFLIGQFFNFVIPGGVGGDLVKAYYLKKENSHQAKTSPYTVIFDRFIGLYVMILIATVAMALNHEAIEKTPQLLTLSSLLLSLLLALTTLIFSAFNKTLRDFFHRMIPTSWKHLHTLFTTFMNSFEFYAKAPRRIAFCFLLSLMSQTLAIGCLYVAGMAVDVSVPLHAYFFVAPIGLVLSALPISPPGGIGVGQAAFFFLFNLYTGQKTSLGPTVVTIFQFANLSIGLAGLYFYLVRKKAA